MRRVDWVIMPWLCFIYFLSFLDRANIGNARLAGLEKDLHMRGHDYNIALSVFFITYALIEPVSNVILKRTSPPLFFTVVMTVWGLIVVCMGLVSSFAGLIVCRVLLGVTEGAITPGILFYLSHWYKRHELGKRMAFWFSANAISG
jgi:sugar phosphate permease